MRRTNGFSVCAVVLLATAIAGCGGDGSSSSPDSRLTVAVAFYPIEEIVRGVGGDSLEIVRLTPPGAAAHDLELTAQTVTDLQRADIVFYLGLGFQPTVEDAVAALSGSVIKVDLLDYVSLLPVTAQLAGTEGEVDGEVIDGNTDPHVWVDPANMITMTAVVERILADEFPAEMATFSMNARAYEADLARLDEHFSTRLALCESRTIVTSHRAFEYLAQRYDLKQIPIAGISPAEEPGPESLEAVAALAKADGVSVVFFEEQVPNDLAETIAREIGAKTDALDPVESITQDKLDAGESYITIQETNLDALVRALRCS